jgi:hypothetical protein
MTEKRTGRDYYRWLGAWMKRLGEGRIFKAMPGPNRSDIRKKKRKVPRRFRQRQARMMRPMNPPDPDRRRRPNSRQKRRDRERETVSENEYVVRRVARSYWQRNEGSGPMALAYPDSPADPQPAEHITLVWTPQPAEFPITCDGCREDPPPGTLILSGIDSCCGPGGCVRHLCADCVKLAAKTLEEASVQGTDRPREVPDQPAAPDGRGSVRPGRRDWHVERSR